MSVARPLGDKARLAASARRRHAFADSDFHHRGDATLRDNRTLTRNPRPTTTVKRIRPVYEAARSRVIRN
jgi:hypothetical protein